MTQLYAITPENFKMDGGACFGVVPKSIWSKQVPADENNMVNLSSRCLLVVTPERKILIDTGLGNKQSERYYGFFHLFDRIGIEGALMQYGFLVDDITDVILTHLHFDHVGGALKWSPDGMKPLPVFPNATYYCSKAQWESAQEPNPREAASYFSENYISLHEEGRLEFIFEDTSFCKEVDLELKYGHTIGQIIPIIDFNGRKVVFTADFFSTLFNIPLPYVPSYDIDPIKTMEEKKDFLNRAVREDFILFFEHDYHNECCTLVQTPKGVRAGEVMTLSQLKEKQFFH